MLSYRRETALRGADFVVDFLLALIELFSLGVTAEALRAIISSKSTISLQRRPGDPKFQVQVVAPPTVFILRN